MLYTLNICNFSFPLYLNKAGKKEFRIAAIMVLGPVSCRTLRPSQEQGDSLTTCDSSIIKSRLKGVINVVNKMYLTIKLNILKND